MVAWLVERFVWGGGGGGGVIWKYKWSVKKKKRDYTCNKISRYFFFARCCELVEMEKI